MMREGLIEEIRSEARDCMIGAPQHYADQAALLRRAEQALKTETIIAAALRIPVADNFKSTMWEGQRVYPDFLTISAPAPARHGTLLHPLSSYGIRVPAHDQGFLTSEGRFVSRAEAYEIAVASGQPMIEHGSNVKGCLFSEDLW